MNKSESIIKKCIAILIAGFIVGQLIGYAYTRSYARIPKSVLSLQGNTLNNHE